MSDKQQMALGVPQAESDATCETVACDKSDEQAGCRPYLNVFGVDIGVFEFALPEKTVIIGRSADAAIRLPSRRVSRIHAKLEYCEGKYTVVDADSTSGTVVNGLPREGHVLGHGDSIQIDTYVLQYRTHPAPLGAEAAAARAKQLLRAEFCTLPSTMRLRVRTLGVDASEVFSTGDTLTIGQGGLLIPVSTPIADGACLELNMAMSRRVTKQYLGEIMGVMEEEGVNWMCVKLHSVARAKIEEILGLGEPGPWIDVAAT